jgi:hypothetical protein
MYSLNLELHRLQKLKNTKTTKVLGMGDTSKGNNKVLTSVCLGDLDKLYIVKYVCGHLVCG